MDSIISRVLRHVIGFVNAPNNAGLKENVFHIFEQSIAYRVRDHLASIYHENITNYFNCPGSGGCRLLRQL